MIYQQSLSIKTNSRGSYEITENIQRMVKESGVATGICQVFVQHTSASLMLCENADPTVRSDLESFMARLAPDGDSRYRHDDEGPDDMPAHIRSVLTQSGLSLPISRQTCLLGTWQGVYLWEHRTSPHTRSIIVTIYGEQA